MFGKLKITRKRTIILAVISLFYVLVAWAGLTFRRKIVEPLNSQLEQWQPQFDEQSFDPPPQYQIVNPQSEFEILWKVHPVYADYRRSNATEIHLSATKERILFLGNLDAPFSPDFSLISFDLLTGQRVWHKTQEPVIDDHLATTISANDELVYVGFDATTHSNTYAVNDSGKVIAYDAISGEKIWVQELNDAIYVESLNVSDQSVSVNTSGGMNNYIFDPETGKIVREHTNSLWFMQIIFSASSNVCGSALIQRKK